MKPLDLLNKTYDNQAGSFFAELTTDRAIYARCLMRKQGKGYDVWYIGVKTGKKGRLVQSFEYEEVRNAEVIRIRKFVDEGRNDIEATVCRSC